MPPLTPPCRVKKAWRIAGSPSSALSVIVDWAVTRRLNSLPLQNRPAPADRVMSPPWL